MNEEELKKGCGKETDYFNYIDCNDNEIFWKCGEEGEFIKVKVLCPTCQARLEGFQKGKLEQKKEELKRIIELQKKIRRYLIDNSRCDCLELTTKYGDISDVLFWEYEKQLQEEIGGNSK